MSGCISEADHDMSGLRRGAIGKDRKPADLGRNHPMITDQSELDDFKAVLTKYGHSEGDFELSSEEAPLPIGNVSPVTGSVKVKHKMTGIERTYGAGHGTAWVVEFEKDLEAGRFS
jgi:hypothetical protein